jgi:hypothetical protein
MTDVAYLCQNCRSVHEVDSVRENFILDPRTAASYELSGQRGMLDPRALPALAHDRFRAWLRRHSWEDTASRARRLTALQHSPTAFTAAAGRCRVKP